MSGIPREIIWIENSYLKSCHSYLKMCDSYLQTYVSYLEKIMYIWWYWVRTGYWVTGCWCCMMTDDWTTGHHDILWLVDWMSDDNSDNPMFWLDALVQFGGLIGSYIGSLFLIAGRVHSDSWHSDTDSDSWLDDLSWLWDLIGAIRCCHWLGHVIGWMIPETRCELASSHAPIKYLYFLKPPRNRQCNPIKSSYFSFKNSTPRVCATLWLVRCEHVVSTLSHQWNACIFETVNAIQSNHYIFYFKIRPRGCARLVAWTNEIPTLEKP